MEWRRGWDGMGRSTGVGVEWEVAVEAGILTYYLNGGIWGLKGL